MSFSENDYKMQALSFMSKNKRDQTTNFASYGEILNMTFPPASVGDRGL